MRSFEDDSTGARALNWAIIAGAGILLMVSLLALAPVGVHQAAPTQTVEVTGSTSHG